MNIILQDKKLNDVNLGITIHTYKDKFQELLVTGWEKLKKNESFNVYAEAFKFFLDIGLYEGLFRPYIPNPVYDNAAKEVGQDFLEFALNKGIYFKELFPGNFKESTESDIGDKEYRFFYMTPYHNQKKLGVYKLSFQHCHDHFDFEIPPILEIYSDVQNDGPR